MATPLKKITKMARRLVGLELDRTLQTSRPKKTLGTPYGAHTVCLDGLGPDAVIYSFGVGEDISFDVELIAETGAQVYAFDPTPRSIDWVKAQPDLPESFHLLEYGIADYDGTASFNPPENPEHISHTLLDRPKTSSSAIEVVVKKLATIMAELNHTRLDVLKLDVEGAEYGVIDDILGAGADIDQVLIEFHHQFKSVPVARTRDAIEKLNAAGYKVFHISESGHEYSFIRD